MEENTNTSTTHIHKTEKANSFETGRAGARFKIFFEDVKGLKKMIDELQVEGFEVGDGV